MVFLNGARMPGPYSLDLRRRAVAASEKGDKTQLEIARQFSIGLRTLKEWIFLKKTTGDVRPKEHVHRGRLPIIGDKGLAYIESIVKSKPDILISEIQSLYAKKFHIKVAQSTVSMALKKLKLRRKKKSSYAIEQEREDVKKKRKMAKRSEAS